VILAETYAERKIYFKSYKQYLGQILAKYVLSIDN
jgi:hypothetical protein